MLISTDEPLSLEQMKQVLDNIETSLIKEEIEQLKQDYVKTDRSFEINEVAGGYQIVTKSHYTPYLKKLYKSQYVERLTKPALETLAIIAYKQPVTRLDIESIRGVNVDGVMKSLSNKSLIKIKGRKEVIGRPFIYGTSNLFLRYFGLNSLEELPNIEEFKKAANETQQIIQTDLKESQIDIKENKDEA